MKKITLLLIFVLNFTINAQEFANTKIEKFTTYQKNTKYSNDEWYCNKDKDFCFKYYNQTPIGIKKILVDLKSYLRENNIKFENHSINSSFLSSVVRDIEDYELLNATILQESSIVHMEWRLMDLRYLVLDLEKSEYKITFFKL